MALPPLPPGFQLDTPQQIPPLPPGFSLDAGQASGNNPKFSHNAMFKAKLLHNEFKKLGFAGSAEELAAQIDNDETHKNDYSPAAGVMRDIPVGTMQGVAGLADIGGLMTPSGVVNQGRAIYNYFRKPSMSELVTGKEAGPDLFPLSGQVAKIDAALATPRNTPQTGAQRIVRDITRAGSGTLATMGVGGAVAGPSSMLASNPGMQMVSSATGATASGLTREAGGGKVAQTIAGLAGGLAPSLAKAGVQRLIGEPSKEAKVLLDKGVDLTPGQQRPGGKWSQMEDAIQDWPLIGPSIKSSKESASNQAKEAFLLEGAAPGATVKPTGDLKQTLSNVSDTFIPAYDKVNGFPIKPVIMNQGQNTPIKGAIARVIADKGIDATDASRKEAASWLGNLLTRKLKTSEDVLSLRSELRSRIREMSGDTTESAAKRDIYQRAEKKITEVLESQLPPPLLKELKSVDAQYAKHMIGVEAMVKAKDRPGGFTWNEASTSAQKSAIPVVGKKGYAKGQGIQRDIPEASAKVFAQTPPTGARVIAHAAGIPLVLPITAGTTSKTFRNFMANNKVGPYKPPVAAMSDFLSQRQWEQR